ncbi:MAG: hypothetical protein KF812_05275 [Fimbriimonadaceae bacterium]|nr:hypothetical protein [Fimbriimonadaceae bacterium]
MRKALLLSAGVAILLVAGAIALNVANAPVVANLSSNATNVFGTPRHPVTPDMEAAAARRTGQVLAGFTLSDDEGNQVDLEEEVKAGPIFFLGVKDGCPCNIDAQNFFNDLYAAYGDKVRFYGVMDAGEKEAKLFRTSLNCKFPLLISPKETAVFESLGTEQSVFTTLVGADGKIIKQWPGYSKSLLLDINRELAKISDKEAVELDLTMAPEEPASGCFFFQPVGTEPPSKGDMLSQ